MIRNRLKQKISASCGFGLLRMVSELNTGRCASNEAKPRRGMDTRWCANKDIGPHVPVSSLGLMCQQGGKATKGMNMRQCVSEEAKP